MKAIQLSVFLERNTKQLTDCLSILSNNNIAIHAMTLIKNKELDVMHCVVDEPDKASKLFRKNGMGVGETEIMILELSNKTMPLQSFLQTLKRNKRTNIEYMYMGSDSQYVFRFDNLDSALQAMKSNKNKI